MPSKRRALLAASGQGGDTYVDDVFSAYTYTGTGAAKTITNGIDIFGEGGLVWIKDRNSGLKGHALFDTTRTGNEKLQSQSTNGEFYSTNQITSFNSDGFTLGTLSDPNGNGTTYVSWTFRNAANFFKETTVTKAASTNATVDLSSLGTVGAVVVKRTDSTGSWYVWHRSLTAGKLLILNTTAAEATLGHITVSGTTLTLVDAVIADGDYVVYAWAHDDSDEGLIQCGSFTLDGSFNATVALGWEPQFIQTHSKLGASNHVLTDSSRGMPATSSAQVLYADSSASEAANAYSPKPTATGFTFNFVAAGTFVYIAIRRSNKPPEVGTDVFAVDTGSGASSIPTFDSGFPVDLALMTQASSASDRKFAARLTGANYLRSNTTDSEASVGAFTWDSPTGWAATFNSSWTSWMFKRAPGFMDVVCYTGTGANLAVSHNLTAVPSLMIVKSRSNGAWWPVYSADVDITGATVLGLNYRDAKFASSQFNGGPTATTFQLVNSGSTNTNAQTYVAYLFATLAGISKVGSYTGNGSSQTINAGFTTGARFILIKRTDSTGDWFVWDTTRGIVAGNDPHLSLNTTAAEVTTDDSVDTDTSGFIVNQVAATNINVSAATYIFLAIA